MDQHLVSTEYSPCLVQTFPIVSILIAVVVVLTHLDAVHLVSKFVKTGRIVH